VKRAVCLLLVLLFAAEASAQDIDKSVLVRAMRDELKRSTESLQLPGVKKPYFIAYTVVDREEVTLEARFGALIERQRDKTRKLRVQVRVGDKTFDNTGFVQGFPDLFRDQHQTSLVVADDYRALRRGLWLATDSAYKDAGEGFAKKRAAKKTQADDSEAVDDFADEKAARSVVSPALKLPDVAAVEAVVKKLSAVFRGYTDIQVDRVVAHVSSRRRIFLSSEGTMSVEPQALIRLDVWCRTQGQDGRQLSDFLSYAVPSLDRLPPAGVLADAVDRMAQRLSKRRGATPMEDYNGPVLFEGVAAAQLMKRMLADNLAGTPAPTPGNQHIARVVNSVAGASEWSSRLGQKVMSVNMTVVDDPTITTLGSVQLIGGYAADAEGVAARRVTLVDGGKLKALLMSRTPIKGLPNSNGHARRLAFGGGRAGIANLVVSGDRGVDRKKLIRRLLAEVKKAGTKYGVVVRLLEEPGVAPSGGSTIIITSGRGPVVSVLEILKVTPDGKEQPMRGAALGLPPLRALKEIVAVGLEPTVISSVQRDTPTSVVAPALLFKDLAIKPQRGKKNKPPLLAHPFAATR
jgi:hypothetical protein